jgi:hypothetical protein
MFTNIGNVAILTVFILSLSGCFGGYSVDTGLEVSEIVFLDQEHEAELRVDEGAVFGLDMPDPVTDGYSVTGAFFDPKMFRMERYIAYEDDGPRIRYLFTAVANGAGDVSVKMRSASGGADAVYRTVEVVVGGESGILF